MPTFSGRSARIITVINLKGGVGKTHTVWSLLGVCQELGMHALAVDTDTQGNLSRTLLPNGSRVDLSVLFQPSAEADGGSLIHQTQFPHIDILPSSQQLAPFDVSERALWEKSDLHLNLAELLDSKRRDYDFIFIDCPPRLSLVSFASLCAADYVVIPLEAADWGAQGVVEVTEAVEFTRKHYIPRLTLLGYLISRFKPRRHYQASYAQKLREHFGPLAFDTMVPDLARYEKSVTHAIPITLHAPGSREAHIARRLFAEVSARIERHRGRSAPGRRTDVFVAAEPGASR